MKIIVIGTRGFPGIQGGVENHCENLYTKMEHMEKYDVYVFTREPYVTYNKFKYKGVTLLRSYCPRLKYLETVIHTLNSMLIACKLNPDVVHVHAIGSSFIVPFIRALGIPVVVTHHGPDYQRAKWNIGAKLVLRFCEWMGMTFASQIITITDGIASDIALKFHRKAVVIPNGVNCSSDKELSYEIAKKYDLQKRKYILIVGRFVPEKGFHDLIEAFIKGNFEGWKLVIVGGADHEGSYSRHIREKANNENIVLTGILQGEPLSQLYSNAALFVLPSYYEGLPIVLLEAMSYGLPCIVSNISATQNLGVDPERYFDAGNVEMLLQKLRKFINVSLSAAEKKAQIDRIKRDFNWRDIAEKTTEVYELCSRKPKPIGQTYPRKSSSKLKVAVLGTRGFPDIQGGVENHCENLYPRLVDKGCEITVFTRKPYVKIVNNFYKGVFLATLPCPKNKYLEAISHTALGIMAAWKIRPDILHIHSIGPSVFAPVARVLGMKVVVTHHGENYKHQKWGLFSAMMLRLCEFIGVKFANKVITISDTIALSVWHKFHEICDIIPNGVNIPILKNINGNETLSKLGLEHQKYFLAVGRYVPEKGLHDLMAAFEAGDFGEWKLVVVGGADHEDDYSKALKEKAAKNSNIILTGVLTHEPLHALYKSAGLFVVSSYYEGLPIALLEALSFGISCIATDIPGNRSIKLSDNRFMKPGDVEMMKSKMQEFSSKPITDDDRMKQINYIASSFNWGKIADDTLSVYQRVIC